MADQAGQPGPSKRRAIRLNEFRNPDEFYEALRQLDNSDVEDIIDEEDEFEPIFEFQVPPRIPIEEEEENEDANYIDDYSVQSPIQWEVVGGEEDEHGATFDETPSTPVPLSTPSYSQGFEPTAKTQIRWKRGTFEKVQWKFDPEVTNTPQNCDSPYQYFRLYFTSTLIDLIAEKTNAYAMQSSVNLFVTSSDIEDFIALHILSSVYKLPRIRMYWSKTVGVPAFYNTMSREKFFRIRTCFHVVDNLAKPATTDIFWKIRPLFEAIQERCRQLPVEQNVSIDEQMVPFTGKHQAKQYIRGKPCPWGFKFFMLCGQRGLVYDFMIYQGSSTEISKEDTKTFGYGGAVVLKLAERLKPGHCLFFDNYFSSYPILQLLQTRGISATGTIRLNRFANPPLKSEQELRKKGRGSSDEVFSEDGIVVVRWIDNKSVHLASNNVGIGQATEVRRWQKTEKAYVDVQCPEIIKAYNKCMGGVDLTDQLLSTYRIFLRSKKWTLRMIFHAVDLAVVNAWNEYRQEMGRHNHKNIDLLDFKSQVADSLLHVGKVASSSKKRGRPRRSDDPEPPPKKQRTECHPARSIRFDKVDHLPYDDGKGNGSQTRCKRPGCTGRTNFYCKKCKIHLCLTKISMCFTLYHDA